MTDYKNTHVIEDYTPQSEEQKIKDFDSDDNSVLVIILKCETKACDQNIKNLKSMKVNLHLKDCLTELKFNPNGY